MVEKSLSLLKIIRTDYWAFLLAMFSVIFPAIYIYDYLRSGEFIPNFNLISIGFLGLSVFGLISRCISIITIFNSGWEVKATVSEIGFFRGRGYIKYIFPFQNGRYVGVMNVMKNKATSQFRVGDEVIVIVSRDDPKKSFIRDLFI